MAICVQCRNEFKIIKNSQFLTDGLCGKCRSRNKYLSNVDLYRKTNLCPFCGKKILLVSKACNHCSQLGNRNHQWKEIKGDRGFYFSQDYLRWRKSVLKRFDNKCALCNNNYRLAAHHIYPRRDFPEKVFDVDNGIPLCHKHHCQIHLKEEQYIDYFTKILAKVKLCELGEGCNANTEPSQIYLEGVTTRDEINFPTSAGQPL